MNVLIRVAIILALSSSAYVMTNELKREQKVEGTKSTTDVAARGNYKFSPKKLETTNRALETKNSSDMYRKKEHSIDAKVDSNLRTLTSRHEESSFVSTKELFPIGHRKFSHLTKGRSEIYGVKNVKHSMRPVTFHRATSSPRAAPVVGNSYNLPSSEKKTYFYRGHTIGRAVRRHRTPHHVHHSHHRNSTARKRNRVVEALNDERQNIGKAIDTLDDIPGSYNRGLEEEGMDIKEVNMIDNNTLSDYFHALNDNVSGDVDSGVSIYTQAGQPKPWEESTASPDESGNDEFYDAIDRGEKPPISTNPKKISPTKAHQNERVGKVKTKSGSVYDQSSVSPSQSSTRPPKFRMPSREDFENFFRGMLGNYNEEGQEQHSDYKNMGLSEVSKSAQHPTNTPTENEKKISTFLAKGGNTHGNVTKLVSLGDPETVDGYQDTQKPSAYVEQSSPFASTAGDQMGRDGEGLISFAPAMTPTETQKRPYGNNNFGNIFHPISGPSKPADNIRNLPTQSSTQTQSRLQGSVQQPKISSLKQQNERLQLGPFKGTRIRGGKISGGQISGGVIEGGQIKAGLIEGGLIKGGQVLGGRIANGTMEGGVVANGQMLGGHLVDGRIEGGLLVGGNVFGGRILGGRVEGGNIKGGVIAGGRFRGGNMQGGVLNGGEVQGGNMKGGKVEGGILHSGNIEGGDFKFGDISGGTLKSGSMLGGELKNGSIEGGTLVGGTIEGGVLKGGVMEGGKLKGGIVLAGKIKGGLIEGGVIEGGEIGDGVVIKNGTVNATISTTGKYVAKSQKLGELFRQHQNPQQLEMQIKDNKYHSQGKQSANSTGNAITVNSGPMKGLQNSPKEYLRFNKVTLNSQVKLPPHLETLKLVAQDTDGKDEDNPRKLLLEDSRGSSAQRLFEDEDGDLHNVLQKKGTLHHVVLDGISLDIPNKEFGNLIEKLNHGPKELVALGSFFQQHKKRQHTKLAQGSKLKEKATDEEIHIKPEDIEMKLSPTKPRSSVTRSDNSSDAEENSFNKENKQDLVDTKNRTVSDSFNDSIKFGGEDVKGVSLNAKDNEKLRPTYHWSLNKLIKPDRIPGSPGPAIRTHGAVKVIRGGLHFNGHDAWLGAGDFSGGCISDPETCDDGLSFEMTLRMDKDALKYSDMNYIVDSGASTFNSKGFTLYTVHGNLRADLAIANQELCLQIPLVVRSWQDILITWKKNEGMKMYVNCELKAHTKGDEHCIGCHASGCHVTDSNTLLMIGRPNYSPHFHCTKFDSGDISFWEKYLSDDDIHALCGIPTGESGKSKSAVGFLLAGQQSKFPGRPAIPVLPVAAMNGIQNYPFNQPSYASRYAGLIRSMNAYTSTQHLFTQWSAWSACSKTCGIGRRARRRACIDPRLFIRGGLCSGLSIQHQSCFDRACPVTAYTPVMTSPFYPGPNRQPFFYNRAPYYTGIYEGLSLPQISRTITGFQAGLTRSITVDGGYSEWSVWGTCDRACGGGAQVRTRICNNPPPSVGEKTCHSQGPAIQVRRCNRKACPVDGGYSPWSAFTPCSKTCGSGAIQKQFRTCSNPPPSNGGKPCFGHALQTRACNNRRCPVDGGYSIWSPWSPCDADCGGGIMERNRFCDNPVPRFGGKDCPMLGPDKETRLCNVFACSDLSIQGRKRFKIIHPTSSQTKISSSELNDALVEM